MIITENSSFLVTTMNWNDTESLQDGLPCQMLMQAFQQMIHGSCMERRTLTQFAFGTKQRATSPSAAVELERRHGLHDILYLWTTDFLGRSHRPVSPVYWCARLTWSSLDY